MTIAMRQGDIIKVAFPFTNFRGSKIRSAVIISQDSYNDPDYIIAFITSKDYSGDLDFKVCRGHPEFAGTGLSEASTFRVGKIVTCHNSLIQGKVGVAGPSILAEINKRLKMLFSP
jgi:mRNA-degrading endonuclease toxin of MazEF toxin-antitoxin module